MTVSLETYSLCSVLRWNIKGAFYAGQGVVAHSSVDTALGKTSIKNLNQGYAIEVNQINLLNRQWAQQCVVYYIFATKMLLNEAYWICGKVNSRCWFLCSLWEGHRRLGTSFSLPARESWYKVLSNVSRREARNGVEQGELNKDMLRHRYTVNDAGSSARGLKFSEICWEKSGCQLKLRYFVVVRGIFRFPVF